MRHTSALAGDDSGQVVILMAISLVVLLGIAALSIDASHMYDRRNALAAAADAAAKSAAIEVRRNPSASLADLQAFANQQVTAHGFNPSGATTVVVNHPPATGPFAGNSGYVEAIVSEPTSTFFGGVTGIASMTPGARAVAGAANPQNCLITMASPGSSPVSLQIGNSTLTLSNCGAASAGDLAGTNPNARITGSPLPSVSATGTCSGTCGAMGVLTTGAPPPTDPLAGLAAPANPGGCAAGTATTLGPGCYTSIATSVQTLTAGIYYVTGPVNIDNLTGTNVLIYLTGSGRLTATNNKDLTLTAPTSGLYAGIAIFQDPSDTNNFSVGNNFTLTLSGALYMPGADVNFPNSIDFVATGCTLLIAKSLNIRNGNGGMDVSGCAATYGSALFLSVSMAE
jgi:Flp pilus assembly protein TadG